MENQDLTVEKTELEISEKEKLDRSIMCSDEINAILKKYNCNLAISGFAITAN